VIQTAAEYIESARSIDGRTWAQVGAVAAISTVALLPVAWLAVKRLVPDRNIVFARWGFSHVAMAIGLLFLVVYAAGALIGGGRSLTGDLAIMGSAFGALGLAIVAWSIRLDPDGVRVLGFRKSGSFRAIAAGLVAYLIAIPGILGLIPLWGWILELVGHTQVPQDIALRFAALSPAEQLLPLVLGVLIQPLLEELVFRSFLQPLLVQNFREVAGVALTSFVFAALHGPDLFLPIFALSCLLGAVMLRTQNLYAVWAMHALNNGIMFAVLVASPEFVGSGGGS